MTILLLIQSLDLGCTTARAVGPLRVHQANPRYFSDEAGNVIYLAGAHTWTNFQDRALRGTFDYDQYLDFLDRHKLNFMRLWVYEESGWSPLAYERTGPGMALDGEPKFDVTKPNQRYYDRLRQRVIEAGKRGIYVAIMLFQGWSIEKKTSEQQSPWLRHPFHGRNNINGIDGDLDGDGEGTEVHMLLHDTITGVQEEHIRRVIDSTNDLDNVLYEIANESSPGSHKWQSHMVDFIHAYELRKPRQHPIWHTAATGSDGSELFAGAAEAISPGLPSPEVPTFPYRDDPPPNDGRKIILNDTDHLWGIGGTRRWVWQSFLRGLHPIYMDAYDSASNPESFELARGTRDEVLLALQYTRLLAGRIRLEAMTPHSDLCGGEYCLADPGQEYLVYLPVNGSTRIVKLDLTVGTNLWEVEWFDPQTGKTTRRETINQGQQTFESPFHEDAVLHVRAAKKHCCER